MMEILAPALLALLFIVFGLTQRGRSSGGCAGCPGDGACEGKESPASCSRGPAEPADGRP
jgi:hypothetical protein